MEKVQLNLDDISYFPFNNITGGILNISNISKLSSAKVFK